VATKLVHERVEGRRLGACGYLVHAIDGDRAPPAHRTRRRPASTRLPHRSSSHVETAG
jgi:hypothetical protein